MTIAATQFPARQARSSADASCADISWRALSAGLWVARRDGRHLGTVQRGRRWLASDADSEPIGAFRTFSEAQAAVGDPTMRPVDARGPRLGGPALAAAGLLVAAVASAGVWTWSALVV
jgi:hypothetical protein